MLEEGVDFKFIDLNDSELTGVAIIKGEYEGVLFHYHKVRIVEEGALARLQFGYTIVHPGTHDIDVLTADENLHTMMGDILSSILMAKSNEQIRTNDSEEPNLQ
jgi:hypothetical protein